MTRFDRTIPPTYFSSLYETTPDPWRFASSDYERAKYDATMAALPRIQYDHILEVGCSIGVLSHQLAARCDRLLAIDAAPEALRQAEAHCRDCNGAQFEERFVPAQWPVGVFDCIVLSEVLYYLDDADLTRLAALAARSTAAGGDIVLVHWLGETNYPMTGDQAADRFIELTSPYARVLKQDRTADYRLDLLRVDHRDRTQEL